MIIVTTTHVLLINQLCTLTVCASSPSGMVVANAIIRAFFFQAEDGIRGVAVTGVQPCALPISHRERGPGVLRGRRYRGVRRARRGRGAPRLRRRLPADLRGDRGEPAPRHRGGQRPGPGRRSEERRVGKECRARGPPWR